MNSMIRNGFIVINSVLALLNTLLTIFLAPTTSPSHNAGIGVLYAASMVIFGISIPLVKKIGLSTLPDSILFGVYIGLTITRFYYATI